VHKFIGSKFAIIMAVALLVPMLIGKANAQDDSTIVVKTTGPLEFPGIVVGPGTYDLRFIDSPTGSDVVEISGQGGKAYGLFQVRPVTRMQEANDVQVELQPESDSPERVKDWFAPGALTGYEPIYPASRQVSVAHSGASSPVAGN
jgi:hypothetical protein